MSLLTNLTENMFTDFSYDKENKISGIQLLLFWKFRKKEHSCRNWGNDT